MDRWNGSFVSTNFDETIHETVVLKKGYLAIFRVSAITVDNLPLKNICCQPLGRFGI
jgi:hypothetical protein